MTKVFLAALIAGGAYWWMRPKIIPPMELPRAEAASGDADSGDPCADKPRCLVIYVAPWCPSCAQARPVMLEIKERFRGSEKLGVKTVVGMDQRPKLEAYAKGLGEGTFLDPDQAFSKAVGVSTIPSWMVTDARGKVLAKLSGSYPDASVQLEKLGLDPESLVKVRP